MHRSYFLIFFCFLCLNISAQPTISFTFDDGVTNDMPGYTFEVWNDMLLNHLDNGGVKAIFFVTGANKRDDKGQFLLKSWNDNDHKISNHTISHPNYNNSKVTFEQFRHELLDNDTIIRKFSNYLPMFRFPYLKEGDTREKIESFRNLMKEHHYKNGYVTIDASDWYIDSRLRMRLSENPKADIEGFRQYYLQHIYDRALYYDDLALRLTGRHINHTLLLHHNLTSALFLGDLIKMFKEKGWKIIDAEEAYKDQVFKYETSNIPAGESLIWAMAKESGKFDDVLRYPAEDSRYEKEAMDKLGL